MARHRSRVSEADAGRRLDAVVAALPGVRTRTHAERLLRDGAVLVDGERRPKSYRVQGGEELDVEVPEPVSLEPSGEPIDVVYEDSHLLVIDKPPGLVVHPAPGHVGETLVNRLAGLGAAGGDPERPWIVHRLDRDTSGLLLVARSEAAYAASRRRSASAGSSGATSRSYGEHRSRARGRSTPRSAVTAASGRVGRSTRRHRGRRSPGSRCANGSATAPCSR